jgi:DNA repair protein RecN (Recombination protein N)
MIHELRVENLLLIERAELRFTAGLNVLTGETGAGKTVLAQALDLLLGGRAKANIVRPGASEAYVEGTFALPAALEGELGERLPAGAEEVVLARRVSPDGRTRAYVNGRSATVGDLRELAERLITFYGQHEHRKLMLGASQLEILDGFCGPEQARRRSRAAAAHSRVRELEAALAELDGLEAAREREIDLLEFELGEIETAAPDEAEYADLLARRDRLRHLDALRAASGAAIDALSGDGAETLGAADLLARADDCLTASAGADARLDAVAERLRTLTVEAQDLRSELLTYGEELDEEPGGLEAVEERLAVLERLMRKHGGTLAAVLDHAERCRARRDELIGAAVAREEATAALASARADYDECAGALRKARRAATKPLAAAVRELLAELAMGEASFTIELPDRPPGPNGIDGVEFVLAPNPGVAAGPLREIASGGELSRVMLALMSVANADGETTLVFDEVDAGIGGHTARAVGERLRALGEAHQVLCITHLPQIASLGARHFSVAKDTSVNPTRTVVVELGESDVVPELVRMLGAGEDDAAARRHARELRRAA